MKGEESPLRWVTDRALPPSAHVERLAAGRRVVEGFALSAEPWDQRSGRLTLVGSVTSEAELTAAVLGSTRGADIVVGCADDGLRARLLDDLARLGPVELVELGDDPLDALDEDQRALLAALADGSSISAAADSLFLSTRTAERRLAAARAALGVRTTAEAIALAIG